MEGIRLVECLDNANATKEVMECDGGIDIPPDEIHEACHYSDEGKKQDHSCLVEGRAVPDMVQPKKDTCNEYSARNGDYPPFF